MGEKGKSLFQEGGSATRMENKIYFDNILEKIEDDFFINNTLGMIIVPFHGLEYLKNEKIMNINKSIVFSVEIWYHESNAVPALANYAMYLIKIPK